MEGAGGGYGSLMGSFGGDNINNNRGMELCPTLMFPNSTTNNSNPDTLLQQFNNQHSNSTPPTSNLMLLHQDHNTTNNPSKNNTISNPSSSCYFMDINTPNNNKDGLLLGSSSSTDPSSSASVKAKIMSHPHYNRLFAAYINCQKIGAPAEVVGRLEEAYASVGAMGGGSAIGEDPALDQFMEAYCEMLSKYEQELSKPFKEAMLFLSTIESQFKALTVSSSSDHPAPASIEAMDRNGLSEEEADIHNNLVDPQAEDQELKGQLLRKYSGYLGNLKQEFMKKRKKGKLPKEARQMLLEWWSRHYKWPYPSESQKVALAETTGLDQKQINNWFINQRKRHWKPSEDMQFMVMDGAHPHYSYMDHNVVGNPFPMDISPPFL